jgi:hypothetical protein
MKIDTETVLDSLFLLGIVLISFGTGMRAERYLDAGNYLPLAVYAGFVTLGFKQLVLE